jgi:hypothetical protein
MIGSGGLATSHTARIREGYVIREIAVCFMISSRIMFGQLRNKTTRTGTDPGLPIFSCRKTPNNMKISGHLNG